MTAPGVRRPPKGHRAKRLRPNLKSPAGRLRELKALFEHALEHELETALEKK